jgi:hypothetical protein
VNEEWIEREKEREREKKKDKTGKGDWVNKLGGDCKEY